MKKDNNSIDEVSAKLLKAIAKNDIALAESAILEGANVNVREHGITALGNAVLQKNTAMIQLLLKNSANVNIKNLEHQRALHYGAWLNELAICELLLENGADVNASDVFGNNPLFKIVNSFIPDKGQKVIELLLHYGGDPNQKNNYGFSAKDVVKDLVNTKSIAHIFDK